MNYNHGGSVWKNLVLLLRGILQIVAFGGVWIGLIYWEAPWASAVFWGGAILLFLCTVFYLILPIFRLFR